MSEYCGRVTEHTKLRGKIHCCEWCGQKIEIGELYATWLWFDGGTRSTVYAHAECSDDWMQAAQDEHGVAYGDGGGKRPVAKRTTEKF